MLGVGARDRLLVVPQRSWRAFALGHDYPHRLEDHLGRPAFRKPLLDLVGIADAAGIAGIDALDLAELDLEGERIRGDGSSLPLWLDCNMVARARVTTTTLFLSSFWYLGFMVGIFPTVTPLIENNAGTDWYRLDEVDLGDDRDGRIVGATTRVMASGACGYQIVLIVSAAVTDRNDEVDLKEVPRRRHPWRDRGLEKDVAPVAASMRALEDALRLLWCVTALVRAYPHFLRHTAAPDVGIAAGEAVLAVHHRLLGVAHHAAGIDDALGRAAQHLEAVELGERRLRLLHRTPHQRRRHRDVRHDAIDHEVPVGLGLVHVGDHVGPKAAGGVGAHAQARVGTPVRAIPLHPGMPLHRLALHLLSRERSTERRRCASQ